MPVGESAMATASHPIVIIDDESGALQAVDLNLRVEGIDNNHTFTHADKALVWMRENPCDVVLLDVIMPDANGIEVLREIRSFKPETPIIMVTGVNEVEIAVQCLKNGANDYLLKPFASERLISSVKNALKMSELERDYARLAECMLSEKLRYPRAFAPIKTHNDTMVRLFKYIESVAPSGHPVLLTGETGTGKELFAQAVHEISNRPNGCVCVNVAGLDDTMFSDTLFGHVKGAYTGADGERKGLIESAGAGTIFLDEIGDLSVQSQVKLLRLIQEREYRRLGSDTVHICNARIVAATCRTIDELSASQQFRKDLYYRLRTHHVHLPPLRERKDDIRLLTEYFVAGAAKELGRKAPHIPPELFTLLSTYHFPGNVRELQAMVFDAVSSAPPGTLSLRTFRNVIGSDAIQTGGRSPEVVTFPERLPRLKEVEELTIREAITRSKGNQVIAADLLGITRQTLAYRLKQIG